LFAEAERDLFEEHLFLEHQHGKEVEKIGIPAVLCWII
jgi:hypothetical protein